jgi:hypothetical protein
LVYSVLTGSAVIVLCWSWLFGLGGTVNHVEIGIVFIAFSGWLLVIFKQKQLRKSSSSPFQLIENKAFSLIFFLVLLIVLFVGLFPKMDSPLHLTMAIRTGPDAVGNSIAVDALLNDGSKFQIQKLLLSEVPALNSVEELLDSGELVYTFSSFSKQVKAEFIVFGLRLGLSGISASILNLIGEQHLWEVLAALPTLAVFCGVLLIFQCLKSNYVTTPFALAAALGGGVNVNLLHGWHEGGLAQSVVFLSTTAIFFGLFTKNLSRLQRFLFAALSSVVGLTVYSDWFIVFSCLLLVCFFLNLLFRQYQFLITRSGPVLVGYGFGFLLCGPFAIDFIRYVPRRINDAAAGGWPMPVWATPAEVFGIFHTYNTSLGTTGYRNGVIYLVFLLNLYLLAFLIRLVCTKFDPLTMTFLLSVTITSGAFSTACCRDGSSSAPEASIELFPSMSPAAARSTIPDPSAETTMGLWVMRAPVPAPLTSYKEISGKAVGGKSDRSFESSPSARLMEGSPKSPMGCKPGAEAISAADRSGR